MTEMKLIAYSSAIQLLQARSLWILSGRPKICRLYKIFPKNFLKYEKFGGGGGGVATALYYDLFIPLVLSSSRDLRWILPVVV